MIDAVGMEAHGAPFGKAAQAIVGLIPDAIAAKMMEKAGVDRLSVINAAIDSVRRGGTISLSGVYGGMLDPLPMLTMFDKQINLRMGQANVKRWIDDIMPLLEDEDVLGVDGFATHRLPLDSGAGGLRDVPEEAGRRDQDPAAALGVRTDGAGGWRSGRPAESPDGLVGVRRGAEVEALRVAEADAGDAERLLRRLHALGDRRQLERVGQRGRGRDDLVVAPVGHPEDEGAVELEDRDRQGARELAQRGVAGAEVVERQARRRARAGLRGRDR